MSQSETLSPKINKMGVRPVFPLLMSMAFPPMISMLIQSLYNIVDGMYVAQYSQDALTAVSLAFPIQNLILAVAVGAGVGVNSYIARKLGEGNRAAADNAVAHGLLLCFLHTLLFIVLSFFCIEPFFHLFTSSEEIFTMGCEYTEIVTLFCFGTIFHIMIEKILQATGKMVYPMILQAVGAIVNIILDPVFIFGYWGLPSMGVRGAAIATIIGQITSMLLSFVVLFTQKHEVSLDLKRFRFSPALVRNIYSVGFPSILMTALSSVLVMGLNAILVRFSNLAVSVFGIYIKVQTFVLMPVSGLTQGDMPIMAYNYGAKNRKRLLSALRYGMLVSAGIMLFGTLLFCVFPLPILRMFSATEEMMSLGSAALRIISLSYLPAACSIIFATLFQSMGRGNSSLIIFLLRQLLLLLPLSYLFAGVFGLNGVWWSFPAAELLSAGVALFLFIRIYHRDPIFRHAESSSMQALDQAS